MRRKYTQRIFAVGLVVLGVAAIAFAGLEAATADRLPKLLQRATTLTSDSMASWGLAFGSASLIMGIGVALHSDRHDDQ